MILEVTDGANGVVLVLRRHVGKGSPVELRKIACLVGWVVLLEVVDELVDVVVLLSSPLHLPSVKSTARGSLLSIP